jgi:ribose transport system substrate-binding protein
MSAQHGAVRPHRRPTRPLVGIALVALLAGTVSACGSSSSSSSATTTGGGTTGTTGASAASPKLTEVKSQLADATAAPVFTDPGPAFDAKPDAGKTIFNMDSDSADPFYDAVDAGVEQAATAAHLKYVNYTNQGTVSEWIQGMDQAISEHVGAIILGGINPKDIAPQIKEAEADHIAVEESHQYEKGTKTPSDLQANNYGPFAESAKLMAEYAIAQTSGHVDALIITDNEFPSSMTEYDAMKSTFATECGSGCKVTAVNEVITDWATGIQPSVESALTSDPSINWILPVYDSMSEYVVPGVEAKGLSSKVSVASYNGTPFVLKDVEDPSSDGGIVKMDVGETPAWIGWSSVDQVLRLMAGKPPAPNDVTPYRVFTKANVALTGTPPVLGQGYGGNSYVTGYEKLWGVGS